MIAFQSVTIPLLLLYRYNVVPPFGMANDVIKLDQSPTVIATPSDACVMPALYGVLALLAS